MQQNKNKQKNTKQTIQTTYLHKAYFYTNIRKNYQRKIYLNIFFYITIFLKFKLYLYIYNFKVFEYFENTKKKY